MNAHWPLWIFASCAKYFDDWKGDYQLFVDGDNRSTRTAQIFAELQLEGPTFNEVSRKLFQVDLTLHTRIIAVASEIKAYEIHDIVGHFASLYDTIGIYKFGPTDDLANTGDRVGCLKLMDAIKIRPYGIVDFERKYYQTIISGEYQMFLTGD